MTLNYQDWYIELHRLSRKERNMTCHENPGPGYNDDLEGTLIELSLKKARCLHGNATWLVKYVWVAVSIRTHPNFKHGTPVPVYLIPPSN